MRAPRTGCRYGALVFLTAYGLRLSTVGYLLPLAAGPATAFGGSGGFMPFMTFIARAIIEPTSERLAGRTTVLLLLAMWPSCSTYFSATRSCTASTPPSL